MSYYIVKHYLNNKTINEESNDDDNHDDHDYELLLIRNFHAWYGYCGYKLDNTGECVIFHPCRFNSDQNNIEVLYAINNDEIRSPTLSEKDGDLILIDDDTDKNLYEILIKIINEKISHSENIAEYAKYIKNKISK